MNKMNLSFKMFEKAGKKNTDDALNIAKTNADANDIKDIVVASTSGATAQKAVNIFDPKEYNLVIVTHNYGFKDKPQEFDLDVMSELKGKGVKFCTATLAFSGVDSALQKTYGFWDFPALYARIVRTVFSDGVKVCQEMVLMVTDGGYVNIGEDVIAVAGTGHGADTVCLIKSASSRKFVDARIKAILAKPL